MAVNNCFKCNAKAVPFETSAIFSKKHRNPTTDLWKSHRSVLKINYTLLLFAHRGEKRVVASKS